MSWPLVALYAVVRGGIYLSLLLLIGHQIADRLVAATAPDASFKFGTLRRIALPAVTALLMLIAAKGALQLLSFLDPGDHVTFDFAVGILWSNSWGHAWHLQLAATVLLLLWLRFGQRDAGAQRFVAPLLTAIIVFAQTGMGHAAGGKWHAPIGRLLDMAHVGGLGIWIGTLAVLAIAAFPSLRGDEHLPALANVVRGFSLYARTGVLLVILSGTIAALVYVGPIVTITQSTWGRLLLLKLGAMAGVMALGWYNWRVVTPALEGAHASCRERLRFAVRFELLLALVMLAITTMLVVSPMPGEG